MTGPLQQVVPGTKKQITSTDNKSTASTASTKKPQVQTNTNPYIQKISEINDAKNKTSFENLLDEINKAFKDLVEKGLNDGLNQDEQVSLSDFIDHKNEQSKQKFLNAVRKNLTGDNEAIKQQFLAGEAVLDFLNKCDVINNKASQDQKVTSVNVYQGQLKSDYGDEISYRYQPNKFLALFAGEHKIFLKPDGISKLACRNKPMYPALQTQLEDAHGLSPDFSLVN